MEDDMLPAATPKIEQGTEMMIAQDSGQLALH
jgi:hypothetical protein